MCRQSSAWIWSTGCGRKRKSASAELNRTSCACRRLTTCRSRILTASWTPSTSTRSLRRTSCGNSLCGDSLCGDGRLARPSRAQLGRAANALCILRMRASAIVASCFRSHRHGFPGPENTLLCLGRLAAGLGRVRSRFRQSFGMKRGDDRRRIFVDHRKQCAGWRFRCAPTAFPMLNSIQTEAEGVGKAGLSHLELVADTFHINFIRHMNLEALSLAREKSLNLVQSSHEFFKRGFHDLSPDGLSPVAVKNIVGTLLQGIALGLRQIGLLVLGEDSNEEGGKFIIAPDIHNPRPAALAHTLARHANLPKSARPRHHIAALRIRCHHCHNVVTLPLAQDLAGESDVRRRFYDGLPTHLVLQWTPSVKRNRVPLDTMHFAMRKKPQQHGLASLGMWKV